MTVALRAVNRKWGAEIKKHSRWGEKMLSVVVYGRNDNHGYNLHKRVALSLNCFAEILNDRDDEIVFVDYNTPDEHPSLVETIQDTLTDKARRTVRIIRAYPSVHRQIADKTPFPVVESLARNIGFRRTNPANRWVLSTNTDMILVPRDPAKSFNDILVDLDDGFYLLPRFELPEALWEIVDRTQPADVISRVRRWGTDFAINEVINRPLVRYDAPGDFQLSLRRDLFALSGMDERMLLGNVHVDSNLCRRMECLRGELRSLVDDMFGYHCAHTRTATLVHGRNKISNDFERFVREVKDWRLFEQDETWGNPEGVVEEIALPRTGVSLFERVLRKTVDPLDKSFEEINWGSARREALRYSVDHMVPFLASSIAPLPKESSIGLVPSRPDVVRRVIMLWNELGFKGEVGMRRSDLARLTDISTLSDLSAPQRIAPYSDEEFFHKHDFYLFEFGLASEVLNGHADHDGEEIDGNQLSAAQEALARFIQIERERVQSLPPRRAIFIGVANNRFEPLVSDNFDITHTPFTSRVRQGFLHVTPQAQSKPAFDPRLLSDAIKNMGQRRGSPPTDEIVRTWMELDDLIQDKPTNFPVTTAHLDLLNVAQTHSLLGLEKFRLEEIARRIGRNRRSQQLVGRQKVGLLSDTDPPLATVNKLADPRDWESHEWLTPVQRFFGGDAAYSIHNRHRDVWLHGQLIYALRGCGFSSNSDVLVVTPHADDVYAVLSQMAGQVSVCRSAFETPSPDFDKKRWLDVPVLARPSRIKFLEDSLGELPSEAFDFVVLARNSGQARGRYGLIRALEHAQRVLAPGGRVAVALDIDVGGGEKQQLISAGDLASLLCDIGEKTGLVPIEKPDFRLSPQALDLAVDADRDAYKPHFVREHGRDNLVAAGLVVLSKRSEPVIEGWRAIKQSRIGWVLGATAERMEVSELYRLVDGAIRIDWDSPAGIVGRANKISLPAGMYRLPLEIIPDDHVPGTRTVLGIEIDTADDLPATIVDVTAEEARKGEFVVNFPVEGTASDDFSLVSIRVRSYGRAGVSVRLGNIRSAPSECHVSSRLDLTARNAIAPNAWRRGEEIVVEREAEHRHFIYGPYQRLGRGWWRLLLNMTISDADAANKPIVELEILHGEAGQLPPGVQLTAARCAQGAVAIDMFVPDTASKPKGFGGAFEFRMSFKGGGRVTVHDFSLESVRGLADADAWTFTVHDVIGTDGGPAVIWLPRGKWHLRAATRNGGRVALVGADRYSAERLDFNEAEITLESPFDESDSWVRLDAEFAEGRPSRLSIRPEHDPFTVADRFFRTTNVSTVEETPNVSHAPSRHELAALEIVTPQVSEAQSAGLYISAAALAGPPLIPVRSMRALDVQFALAGARSLNKALAFVRTHRFDVVRIDFADMDYNMQPIPRLRRLLALKGWLDLFRALRRSCRRIVVEIHQIESRRQGPAKSDILRRQLFAIADEIVLHDETALNAMRQYFPEHATKVAFAANWVTPTGGPS